MPKPSKGTGGAHIRTHSRSSSNTKLGANLQFTQKDLPTPKHTDKPKKAAFEEHTSTKVAPSFVCLNSNQRVHSKEQVAPLKRPSSQRPSNGKSKPDFTIATPSENDDDDDGWISTESGVVTPNHQDSASNTSSETDEDPLPVVTHPVIHSDIINEYGLTRVDTAKALDLDPPKRDHSTPKPATPPLPSEQPSQPPMIHHSSEPELIKEITTAPVSRHSPRPSSKRHSRPPSTHSICSRAEHLRPHPLIRGQSYGHVNPTLPKPAPLAPVTFIPSPAMSHSSAANTSSHESGCSSSGHQQSQHYLSSSPTSMKTSSPIVPDLTSSHRRTSFSSTGSVNTIPIHSSSSVKVQAPHPASVYRIHDRARTLSSSSSSAALSSLTHLPFLSHTRPPSPTPHSISFFPPVNPQHAMEGIHPLLPAPYLSNHMTVLMRRTPIRESYDRVVKVRSGR